MLYSLATQPPGAMALHNFPNTLRAISKKPEEGVWMDLAAVDILRDRERGVPRYNAFREALGMPPVETFADMTSVEADQKLLEEIYGTVDRVDLLVPAYRDLALFRSEAGVWVDAADAGPDQRRDEPAPDPDLGEVPVSSAPGG